MFIISHSRLQVHYHLGAQSRKGLNPIIAQDGLFIMNQNILEHVSAKDCLLKSLFFLKALFLIT